MEKFKRNIGRSRRLKWIAVVIAVTICGLCLTGLTACGHTHDLEMVTGKAATCTEEGFSTYWKCGGCGELFADAEGTVPTTLDEVTVGKTAHDYKLTVSTTQNTWIEGMTVTADALAVALECENCGDTVAVTQGVTISPAGELTAGVNSFTAAYEGMETTFTVTAVAASLTELRVTYTGKTVYKINETFDTERLTVVAAYDNGKTETVTDDCELSCDTSTAGDRRVAVSYGNLTEYIDITVVEKSVSSLTVRLLSEDGVYHVGQTVTKDELQVVAAYDDGSSAEISDYTITRPEIVAGAEQIEVSFAGVTARTDITVHDTVTVKETESTTTEHGTFAHYECAVCNAYFDEDFREIAAADTVMPLMTSLPVTDADVSITDANGASVSLKTESNATFLAGNPNNYYGRLFLRYNLTVDTDTEARIFLNMCERTLENKMNDVFSVRVNGVEIAIGDDAMLPYAAANNWFSQVYTRAGTATLLAGQNNTVEVTRKNLYYFGSSSGNYTYNFFGIGVTPLTETTIAYSEACTHVCPICGGCTDATSENFMCAVKCPGHDEHRCESVCDICGGCKNAACEEEACAEKCGCVPFDVMDSRVTAVTAAGADVTKNSAEGNISANDSNAKKGEIVITYSIRSSVDTTAKLYVRTCSQRIENLLADSYSFTVGGEPVAVDGSIAMPYNEANPWNDIRYTYVGEVRLNAGVNTIVITRADMNSRLLNDYTGFNFYGIALSSGTAALTWAE